MRHQLSFVFAICILGIQGWVQAKLLPPDNPALHYEGRFSDDYRFAWTGSLVEFDFQGLELSADLDVVRGNATMLTVVVDGVPHCLKISKDRKTYALATGLDSEKKHHIVLYKRSEARTGTVQFFGLEIPDEAHIYQPVPKDFKLLVIGDSITCGYGNEAKTSAEGNTLRLPDPAGK